MDFLTHIFLPLTVAFAVLPEWFDRPTKFAVGGFGLVSDFDKFLGVPGLLHSLVTLVPICLGILATERLGRGKLSISPLIVAIVGSHLLLDLVDGGPVPLLFPLIEQGIGLQYPVRTVFGQGPVLLTFEGPLVSLRTTAPRPGYNTYGFINGTGVATTLAFVVTYVGIRRRVQDGSGIETRRQCRQWYTAAVDRLRNHDSDQGDQP